MQASNVFRTARMEVMYTRMGLDKFSSRELPSAIAYHVPPMRLLSCGLALGGDVGGCLALGGEVGNSSGSENVVLLLFLSILTMEVELVLQHYRYSGQREEVN